MVGYIGKSLLALGASSGGLPFDAASAMFLDSVLGAVGCRACSACPKPASGHSRACSKDPSEWAYNLIIREGFLSLTNTLAHTEEGSTSDDWVEITFVGEAIKFVLEEILNPESEYIVMSSPASEYFSDLASELLVIRFNIGLLVLRANELRKKCSEKGDLAIGEMINSLNRALGLMDGEFKRMLTCGDIEVKGKLFTTMAELTENHKDIFNFIHPRGD